MTSTLPLDGNNRPAAGGYALNTGVVALQVLSPTTDGTYYSGPLWVTPSAQQGIVTPYGSNLAATVANTDYLFAWSTGGTTQVNHVMIQNNTLVTVYWEADAVTSLGSPLLYPGQQLFLDLQVTVLHLLTTTVQNVNGTTAGCVCIRAWF